MNRITTLLVLGAFLPIFSFSQTFKTGHDSGKTLPPNHAKSHFSGPNLVQPPVAAAPASVNFPICVFDEMNHQHALEDPGFQQELQQYLKEAVPVLSETSGVAKSTVPPLLTISVVVHVIHNGEPIGTGQNISNEQVQAQIAILNQDFASLNPQFFNTPSAWFGLAGVPRRQPDLRHYPPQFAGDRLFLEQQQHQFFHQTPDELGTAEIL
jgi:hypothetical protein